MGGAGADRRKTGLPLFLLNTVLFPGGQLALKVFEARYLDMVSQCLKSGEPFGVCLLKSGSEVGEAGEPQPVGTLATIERWDMPEAGILHILVRGTRRFRVQSTQQEDQRVVADVELEEPEPALEIPNRYAGLVDFLKELHARDPQPDSGANYADASWVGMRVAELLPVEPVRKQQWLSERDPVTRLASILDTLTQLERETGD